MHMEDLLKKYPAESEDTGQASGLLAGASPKKQAWQQQVYWGDEELPASFWENLMLQGLFSTPKVLIVRNAQNIAAAQFTELSNALANHNPLTWLILCMEVSFEKGKAKIPAHILKQKSFLFASKKNWIWQHFGLDNKSVTRYVQHKASILGLSFEPSALNAFCAAVPTDAAAIDGELEKLFLASEGGLVKAETVSMTGALAFIPDSDIFSFTNHIYAGNIASAWREIYRSQHDIEALLFPFLALLFRDAKTFWQILAGEHVYLHQSSARMKEQCARRLGFVGLGKFFASIVHAELCIKNGERSTKQSLESLVTELGMLFKPPHNPQY